MKLNSLTNNTLLEYFSKSGGDDDIKNALDRIISPFNNSIDRQTVSIIDMINRNPQKIVIVSRRTIERIEKITDSKVNSVTKMKYPDQFISGHKAMDKLYTKIEAFIDEFSGTSKLSKESTTRGPTVSEDNEDFRKPNPKELSIAAYTMIIGLARPILEVVDKLKAASIETVTPYLSFVLGTLEWFLGFRDLVNEAQSS